MIGRTGQTISITASIGLAERQENSDSRDLYRQADQALYRARRKAAIASAPQPPEPRGTAPDWQFQSSVSLRPRHGVVGRVSGVTGSSARGRPSQSHAPRDPRAQRDDLRLLAGSGLRAAWERYAALGDRRMVFAARALAPGCMFRAFRTRGIGDRLGALAAAGASLASMAAVSATAGLAPMPTISAAAVQLVSGRFQILRFFHALDRGRRRRSCADELLDVVDRRACRRG